MLKRFTVLFRVLSLFSLLVIILLNSSKLIEVSRVASAVIVFVTLFLVGLAMLFQTLWHKEDNSCRQNFGFKLCFLLLYFLSITAMLIASVGAPAPTA